MHGVDHQRRQRRRDVSIKIGARLQMTWGAAGRLSQVEILYPSYPRWTTLARHHYMRFDWAARPQVLHYTVKDTHGTVVGYGTIPARLSPCGASWTACDQSNAVCVLGAGYGGA